MLLIFCEYTPVHKHTGKWSISGTRVPRVAVGREPNHSVCPHKVIVLKKQPPLKYHLHHATIKIPLPSSSHHHLYRHINYNITTVLTITTLTTTIFTTIIKPPPILPPFLPPSLLPPLPPSPPLSLFPPLHHHHRHFHRQVSEPT